MGLENPIEACFRWIFDGPSMTVCRGGSLGSLTLEICCSRPQEHLDPARDEANRTERFHATIVQ